MYIDKETVLEGMFLNSAILIWILQGQMLNSKLEKTNDIEISSVNKVPVKVPTMG